MADLRTEGKFDRIKGLPRDVVVYCEHCGRILIR